LSQEQITETGTNLNISYQEETWMMDYNLFGQVLHMGKASIYDDGRIVYEADWDFDAETALAGGGIVPNFTDETKPNYYLNIGFGHRLYDQQGRLVSSTTLIQEQRTRQDNGNTITEYFTRKQVSYSVTKYNDLGQATRIHQETRNYISGPTMDGRSYELPGMVVKETDLVDRTYSAAGLLTHSKIEIHELSPSLTGGGDGDELIYVYSDGEYHYQQECTVSNNKITRTGHGLVNGDRIKLDGTVLPGGTKAGTFYYVINVTANTFQISLNGTTALTLTSSGTAVTYSLMEMAATVNASADTITSTGHKISNGEVVTIVGDTLPGGISADVKYYWVVGTNTDANNLCTTFQLRDKNGNIVNITSAGSKVRFRRTIFERQDYKYTVETSITSYDTVGRVNKMTRTTVANSVTSTETDISNRTYNSKSQLLTSNIRVTEAGKTTDISTVIHGYNEFGLVTRMTRNITSGGITTIETDERYVMKSDNSGFEWVNFDRIYDFQGRLLDHSTRTHVVGSDISLQSNGTTNLITWGSNHGLETGDTIYFGEGNLPSGLIAGKAYEVLKNDDKSVYLIEDLESLGNGAYTTINGTWYGPYSKTDFYNQTGINVTGNGMSLYLSGVEYKTYFLTSTNFVLVTPTEYTRLSSYKVFFINSTQYIFVSQADYTRLNNIDFDAVLTNASGDLFFIEFVDIGSSSNFHLEVDTSTYTHNYPGEISILGRNLIVYKETCELAAGKISWSKDAAPRQYDSQGRLLKSFEVIIEADLTLISKALKINKSNWMEILSQLAGKNEDDGITAYFLKTEILSYDEKGNISRMRITTYKGGVKTVEEDIADRRYDEKGRLIYSLKTITKTDGDHEHVTTIETKIEAFNDLNQATRISRMIIEGDKITFERDIEDRLYDARGNLIYSNIEITECTMNSDPGIRLANGFLAGDIDFDGNVDYDDLDIFKGLYRTTTDDPGFNATADIDGNGKISLGDLSFLAANFRRSLFTDLTVDRTYYRKTEISKYDVAGRILRMKTTTLEDNKIEIEEDIEDRRYDWQSRLISSNVKISKGELQNSPFSFTAPTGPQVYGPVQKSEEDGYIPLRFSVPDPENVVYGPVQRSADDVRSEKIITLTKANRGIYRSDAVKIESSYTVETTISSYNVNDQVLRMATTTNENGGTIRREDVEDREYNEDGRLDHSSVQVTEYAENDKMNIEITDFDPDNDTFKVVDHGLLDGDMLVLNIGMDSGLSEKVYYVIRVDDDTFKLSEKLGGDVLDIQNIDSEFNVTFIQNRYTEETFLRKYDDKGNVLRMEQITRQGDVVSSIMDTEDRQYDDKNRLIYSMQKITRGEGANADVSYLETDIEAYDEKDNILRMTRKTIENTIFDGSGNSNDLTVNNGIKFVEVTSGDSVAYFDGTSYLDLNNIEMPSDDISSERVGERTGAMWFKAENTSELQVLYEEGGKDSGVNMYLFDGKVYAGLWNGSFAVWLSANVSVAEWHTAAYSFSSGDNNDPGTFKLYLDGKLADEAHFDAFDGVDISSKGSAIGGVKDETRFHTGQVDEESSRYFFSGSIDEVTFYDRILGSSEVSMLSNKNSPMVSANDLAAYYSFNNNETVRIESDIEDRKYDSDGNLLYSNTKITEKGNAGATTRDVQVDGSTITTAGHGFSDGDMVRISGGNMNGVFYVKYVDENSFQLSAAPGGASILMPVGQMTLNFTLLVDDVYSIETSFNSYDAEGNVLQMERVITTDDGIRKEVDQEDRVYDSKGRLIHSKTEVYEKAHGSSEVAASSVDAMNNTITSKDHGLSDGDTIVLSGLAGADKDQIFYVIVINQDCYKVSTTPGGTPLDITTQTGVVRFTRMEKQTVTEDINRYDAFGHVLQKTSTIVNGTDITTTKDMENRKYDSQDRLIYSNTETTEGTLVVDISFADGAHTTGGYL
ncbi:MAG: hypothetical protein PHH49_08485, partial [Candidatus Omnitrophica bacterium]|nr:hypothetical protein [Candidatus Omnitrophota bacterium]